MRCSLLVLSSYLDHELDGERTSEVEAHLIGCTRCSTALGYLREEAQRVATLARVHIDDVAAGEMLSLVGLPANGHAPEHDGAGLEHDYATHEAALPLGEGAMPGETEAAVPMETAAALEEGSVHEETLPFDDPDPVAYEYQPRGYHEPLTGMPEAEPTPGWIGATNGQPEPPPPEPPDPEPPQPEPPQPEPRLEESAPAAPWEPPSQPPPVMPERAIPPAPQPVASTGLTRLVNSVRDSVSVRFALMRPRHDAEEAVQIVSGAGAPSWEGRPASRSYQERMQRRSGAVPAAVAAPAMSDEGLHTAEPAVTSSPDVEEEELEATGYAFRAFTQPPVVERDLAAVPVDEPAATVATPGDAAVASPPQQQEERLGAVPAREHDDPIGFIPQPEEERIGAAPAPQPGRHMRSVTKSGGGSRFGGGFGQLTAAVARRTGTRHGVVAIGGIDRRLWIFGAAVAVLLVVGVVIGKRTTPLTPAGSAQPTAPAVSAPAASAQPTVAPTAAPTTAPSATPAPTPPPGPQQLTDVITLGSGATGFSMLDIRYGLHGAHDFRIVFDFSSGSGAPNVTMGFGTPTTFYVEFSGVIPNGQPVSPQRGVVTQATLLEPSPVPGKTIYEFTLTRNVNFVANYLEGPRLVIDLRS